MNKNFGVLNSFIVVNLIILPRTPYYIIKKFSPKADVNAESDYAIAHALQQKGEPEKTRPYACRKG